MGVAGDLLNRVLKTAGQQVDLRDFASRGIVDRHVSSAPPSSAKRPRWEQRRRPLRIGVDVGVLIARASHGFGSMLVDERHLSNMGRAMLLRNEQSDQDAADQAESCRAYVERCTKYVMERIQKLKKDTGAQLLVVLDGATPPVKDRECQERSRKKKEAQALRDDMPDVSESPGTQNKRRMKAARRAGAGQFHSAIVCELIVALRKNRISFLVAPYEADGQLAYFAKRGMVDLVLTEDSDLIAHGCRSILYKSFEADEGGRGIMIQREYLGCMETKPKSLSLLDFSDAMLAVMFVVAGCDYCSSLKQIGSVTARDIVRDAFRGKKTSDKETQQPALASVFRRLYEQTSRKDMTDREKEMYEANFLAALFMYRHPIIFDPFQRKCTLLRSPGEDAELMDYQPYADLCKDEARWEEIVGTFQESTIETHIAEGWISARTKKPFPDMEIPSYVLEDLPKNFDMETSENGDDTKQNEMSDGPPVVHFGTPAKVSENSHAELVATEDEEQFHTQCGETIDLT